ncbi:MAG: FmdB family zinc ribbon protein [Candidatus Omnitrophota bacterium]
MPTYDYRCSSCRKETEVFQSITAKPIRKCPHCGRMTLKRMIGPGAGILFKGTGFYQTDYKSSKTVPGSGVKPAAKKECKKCEKADTCSAQKDS